MAFRRRADHSSRGRNRGEWIEGRGGRSPVPSNSTPPLGEVLATIEHHELEDCTTQSYDPVQISNTQYLTSYNWVSEEHKIIVPGEPPAWTPLSEPTQLREDSGVYFRDLNSARHPIYPLEPMVRAVLIDNRDFCVEDLDVVACGSTLGNLLRFACGKGPAFRMLIEVIGDTVFFSRRENSPTETIQNVRGFGHTFPEAYTTWGENIRNSESHQRLITFDFANMKCLVRFESDGYLPDLIPEHLKIQKDPISNKSYVAPEDILSSMRAATISTVHSAVPEQEPSPLRILKRGRYIPQCAIFDLKTRSARKADFDTLSEQMGRLWIRQIPNFVLAYHRSGKFDDIRVQDVRQKIKQWEQSQQPDLRRFASLLQMVISFARSTEDRKLELEHGEDEKFLNLRIPGGVVRSALPPDLAENWNARFSSSLGS